MDLSLSGSEVNQYYHIIDAESLGHWASPPGPWTPRPMNRKTRRISPNPPASVRPTLCLENRGEVRYGERCAEHGEVMGKSWETNSEHLVAVAKSMGKSLGEDEQKMELLFLRLQLLSFFFGWRNLRNLIQYACRWFVMTCIAKDNYRESTALTKKLMALKGKGESKTVTWRNVVSEVVGQMCYFSPVDVDWTFQMRSGI